MAADLRKIYTAITAVETEQALVDFAERRDSLYPTISKSGLSHWTRVIPFFAFPLDIRKAIYTTNAIESMNMTLRRVLRIVLFPLMIQLSRSCSWELTILLKHGRCPLKIG
ncbi:MAG: transposase [Pseudanabaena sp.]